MIKLFVEYRIEEQSRETYLQWIGPKLAEHKSLQLYEGTDQPGLFVEVWETESENEAESIKKERCGERSSWAEMGLWVKGGLPKVHAWVFRPVIVY